jgi:predicted nucleic acid-binding protein
MSFDVPDGSDVFVDANIFVYHFSGPTEYTDSSTAFLQRIEEGKVSGSTSTLVLAETLHRLMIIEAASALRLEPKAAIRHLKAHPEELKPSFETTAFGKAAQWRDGLPLPRFLQA